MRHKILLVAAAALAGACGLQAQTYVSTDAYSWHGDTITQGQFMATAPTATSLVSTYHAKPGYFMPINQQWQLKNDISSYPRLNTPNRLHQAIYNLGLDEMVNAVEPDTTLRTGKEWAGVWTRDVSYSILLSMAYLQPEASKISLMKKVNANGKIIQDTGSGGAWPVSSDRLIWAVAAFEVYKVTGDRKWLEYIYPIVQRSLEDDAKVTRSQSGLAKGETSFIDWREQSYPKWMQTADIYQSEAMGTSIVHAQALNVLSQMAKILGKKKESAEYARESQAIAEAVNKEMWMADKGYYAMYNYGRNFPILNPRAETLGESLAILYDVASPEQAKSITRNNPTTPFGAAIFFPQIADMPPYHNNSLWPWVASYWALANAKADNEQGVLEAIGSVFRPAALFTTNKENFVLDNGDIATELNSSNMLWCLAGNLALTHKLLFGIEFTTDGLAFHPYVPKVLGADRSLDNFKYRNAVLDISIKGYGNRIKSFKLDGKEHAPLLPGNIKGRHSVEIVMADNQLDNPGVNHTANVKAPWTPAAQLVHSGKQGAPAYPDQLQWQPLEYIDHYVVLRDGKRIATTTGTTFDATQRGEYQVIGVSGNGVESFASEPLSNQLQLSVEMPGEDTRLASPEISYQPRAEVNDYRGRGWVETDHKSGPLTVEVDVPQSGTYALTLRYANGNGPVNTENKCGIRAVSVDGRRIGTFVLPTRGVGNWNDWGQTNSVQLPLSAGRHTVTIQLTPDTENMNLGTNHAAIDRLQLTLLNQ